MNTEEKTKLAKILTMEYMKVHHEIYQKSTDEIVKIYADKFHEFKTSLQDVYISD